MKRNVSLLLFALCVLVSTAQNEKQRAYEPRLNFGKATYQAIYEYDFEDNKTDPANTLYRHENVVLLIGPKYSLYQRYEGMIGDSVANANAGKYMSLPEYIALNKQYDIKPNTYYVLRDHEHGDSLTFKNEIVTVSPTEFFRYKSQYTTASPEITWEISDEKKFINNVEATKAEGDLHGRHWIAWFAESIPFTEGPWELGGLPGLILEAYDSENQHEFSLIKAGPVDKDILQDPSDYEHTSRDAFRKYRKDKYDADYSKWKSGKFPSQPFMNFIDLK